MKSALSLRVCYDNQGWICMDGVLCMDLDFNDTIAAISTPLGFGGIGVVRISGPQAFSIAVSISDIKMPESHRAYHKWLSGNIDEVVITFFRSPKSYTGEDIVEISCHGSPVVVRRLLALILANGARLAGRGEFTKRAFLNNKIDLMQAESVLSLVSAQSEAIADLSTAQLHGKLSAEINALKDSLVSILSEVQASIDFPDDFGPLDPLEKKIADFINTLDLILSNCSYGKLIRNGVNVVIAGKPNVGKSSLLNALLRESRAIVTAIPGTTRDAIVEGLNIKGFQFNIIDTAGIRKTNEFIEQQGINIAKKYIELADLVLLVLDVSQPLDAMDDEMLDLIKNRESIKVLNKIDLGVVLTQEGVKVSAFKGMGILELEEAMLDFVITKKGNNSDVVLTTERQADCLNKAKGILQEIIKDITIKVSMDIVSVKIQEAIEALDEMSGIRVGDEVLDRIFSQFCVGK